MHFTLDLKITENHVEKPTVNLPKGHRYLVVVSLEFHDGAVEKCENFLHNQQTGENTHESITKLQLTQRS